MSELILIFRGYALAPGWCHVIVRPSDRGRKAVLAGELDDNPGTSVTNALEQVAESVSRELLSGDRDFEMYEYVPKGLPKLEPTFYRIEWRGQAGGFSMPTWHTVDPDADTWLRHVQRLVITDAYTSSALISERSLKVVDAREREDLPSQLRAEDETAERVVHTVKTPTGWANKLPGGKVLSNHRKKETAQAAGRREAIKRKAEHVIHKVDGTIGQKNSYGNDPHRSKG